MFSRFIFTFHQAYTNVCSFCRNNTLEYFEIKSDFDGKIESLKKWLPFLHSVTYGGGEPLLFIDAIKRFREEIKLDNKEIIITSRIANKSFEHETFLGNFSKIGEKNELLSWEDIAKVSRIILQSPLLIKCTCSKNNGIDDVDKIINYVEKTQRDIGADICFNDLDPKLAQKDIYRQDQIDKNIFSKAMSKLLKSRKYKIDFYTSRGFEVITLKSENGNVGFRRYHTSLREIKRIWLSSKNDAKRQIFWRRTEYTPYRN